MIVEKIIKELKEVSIKEIEKCFNLEKLLRIKEKYIVE